jgi:uncharacterized membrane protein
VATERIQRSLIVLAPQDRVFALIADPRRTPEWLVGVRSVHVLTSGAIRVGSETSSYVNALGRDWLARGHCVVLEPPDRIVIETSLGPGIQSRSDSRLEALEEGKTRLIAELAFRRPGGPFGMAFSALGVRESIENDFDRSLQKLKLILEVSPCS